MIITLNLMMRPLTYLLKNRSKYFHNIACFVTIFSSSSIAHVVVPVTTAMVHDDRQ
jgi:hypothetical protein